MIRPGRERREKNHKKNFHSYHTPTFMFSFSKTIDKLSVRVELACVCRESVTLILLTQTQRRPHNTTGKHTCFLNHTVHTSTRPKVSLECGVTTKCKYSAVLSITHNGRRVPDLQLDANDLHKKKRKMRKKERRKEGKTIISTRKS